MRARMVKSPWPADIPNGTAGEVKNFIKGHPATDWYEVEWSTGHQLRMYPHEIEIIRAQQGQNSP